MADFDADELVVLNAIRYVSGVHGREWFRADRPEYREAFDRLAAKKYIIPSVEYTLAPDVEESLPPHS